MDDLNNKHHCTELALDLQVKQGGYNNEWMNIFIKTILSININYKSWHEKLQLEETTMHWKWSKWKKIKSLLKTTNMKWQRKKF